MLVLNVRWHDKFCWRMMCWPHADLSPPGTGGPSLWHVWVRALPFWLQCCWPSSLWRGLVMCTAFLCLWSAWRRPTSWGGGRRCALHWLLVSLVMNFGKDVECMRRCPAPYLDPCDGAKHKHCQGGMARSQDVKCTGTVLGPPLFSFLYWPHTFYYPAAASIPMDMYGLPAGCLFWNIRILFILIGS